MRAIGIADVAAGEGALHTCSILAVSAKRKSCTSVPSRNTAWARMPANSRFEIGERQVWAIFAALRKIALFPEGVSHFLDARGKMRSDDFPKTRKRHVVEDILGFEGKFLVAFAGKSKNCVGADDDSSVDGSGEMDSDKRKFWIWNGINQAIDQSHP